MNPPVVTQFAMPDPNAAPLNLTQLFQLANLLVSSAIQGSYIPYVLQSTEPGADDRDKVWFVLDSQGRPIAIKTWYNGHWRRVYNGMIGEIRGFNGDPTNQFDSNGKGILGADYDGWHLCNGKDGTPDLSDQFVVGAHMNNSNGQVGWASGEWRTFVDGKTITRTGGVKEVTLTEDNTYRKADVGIAIDHFMGDTGRDPTGHLYGKPNVDADETFGDDPGNQTPDPIPILPPFVAFAWIIFVGYST